MISAVCCAGKLAVFASCGTARPAAATFTEDDQGLYVPLAAVEGKSTLTVRSRRFDEPLLLTRNSSGDWVAIRLHCPHKGCTVVQREDKLVCPCHGSQFSATGELLKGPARQSLTTFPVSATDKQLVIRF